MLNIQKELKLLKKSVIANVGKELFKLFKHKKTIVQRNNNCYVLEHLLFVLKLKFIACKNYSVTSQNSSRTKLLSL